MLSLPHGSIVPAVDVTKVNVHPHRFRPSSFYVRIELRGGSSARDVAEHLSRGAAQEKKAEIIAAVREAAEEVDPYEYGYQAGFAEGKIEGRSEAFAAGRSQGLQEGWGNGHCATRQGILSAIYQRREAMMQEQALGNTLPLSRRRYLRNAITVLTDLIRDLSPNGQ